MTEGDEQKAERIIAGDPPGVELVEDEDWGRQAVQERLQADKQAAEPDERRQQNDPLELTDPRQVKSRKRALDLHDRATPIDLGDAVELVNARGQ